ncbi:uncharacterized protein EI97DRAFT_443233 [Westerdykella ornata]|uniref:Uncharacterized protein n=1 Tax=Westerdykella ornata TaxID=318751 RepID=A0A6A6JGH1_WESOR|nr:uncharacterized protein EI97DRAFT_443233 [Westerdykella ornata]KAF2275365.1 hypothetical protein EI97DRAFT_443233 [Westerdykella ornata]
MWASLSTELKTQIIEEVLEIRSSEENVIINYDNFGTYQSRLLPLLLTNKETSDIADFAFYRKTTFQVTVGDPEGSETWEKCSFKDQNWRFPNGWRSGHDGTKDTCKLPPPSIRNKICHLRIDVHSHRCIGDVFPTKVLTALTLAGWKFARLRAVELGMYGCRDKWGERRIRRFCTGHHYRFPEFRISFFAWDGLHDEFQHCGTYTVRTPNARTVAGT